MAWRGLHLSQPARLSLHHRRLHIERDEEAPVELPLEDLGWVILDTPQVTMTAALVAACMEQVVPMIISDLRHMPCGVLLPFHQHWQQAGVAAVQINASAPLKKRLWQTVIRRKLTNQAAVLDRCQLAGAAPLREMARRVGSGDPANVEARGARHYWSHLFQDFRRHESDDLRNAMLNYGYAIQRACVARSLVAAGLLPGFGIHHASVTNAFNLADDMLEVLRPATDLMVFRQTGMGSRPAQSDLLLDDRRSMAAIASETFILEGEQLTLQAVSDRMARGLVKAFQDGSHQHLSLPEL